MGTLWPHSNIIDEGLTMLPPSSTSALSFHSVRKIYTPSERRLFDLFHRVSPLGEVSGWEEHLWPKRARDHGWFFVGALLVGFVLSSFVLDWTKEWGVGHWVAQAVVMAVCAFGAVRTGRLLDRMHQPAFRLWLQTPSVMQPEHVWVLKNLQRMSQQSVHLEWLERLEEALTHVTRWPWVYWDMLEKALMEDSELLERGMEEEEGAFEDQLQRLKDRLHERQAQLVHLHEQKDG